MIIDRLNSLEQAKLILPAWNDLIAATTNPNPFYRPEFLLAAWQYLPHNRVQLTTIWQDDSKTKLLGLFPCQLNNRFKRLPARQLETWQYIHCFCGIPLLRTGYERESLQFLLHHFKSKASHTNIFSLLEFPTDLPPYDGLAKTTQPLDERSHSSDAFQRACLHTGENHHDSFEKKIQKKRRKEFQRQKNRLSERGNLEFLIEENLTNRPEVIDDFLNLELSGWKGTNKSALLSTESNRNFSTEALYGAANQGYLHSYRLTLNNETIASLLCLSAGDQLYLFKITFQEKLKQYSPGVQLTLACSHHWEAENNYTLIDSCAAPDHPMIDKLWHERRTIDNCHIATKGFYSKMLISASKAITQYRRGQDDK